VAEWFVRNLRDARWRANELGVQCDFEDELHFPEVGINLKVVEPGQPMWMYHREAFQEDFLVLRGECLLIVEGEELPLRQWDLSHCPGGIAHVIVGAGAEPALVLAVGNRVGRHWIVYPAERVALQCGAGVEQETSDADVAYARFTTPPPQIAFREEFLTG
jgi:uncharacterized cupin superfamily protein